MKTAQQIIGLPVVSIFDGNEIGKVKNVIINASKGTIDFFVIDSGVRSLSGGVIPADRVLGIGEYALTIQQPDDISDIVKIPAAIELMQKNITVRGTRVLTKKGSLLGQAGDIYIDDEDNYNIIGVEFIPSDSETSTGIIPRSSIISFGKDLLVVNNDFIEKLIQTPSAIETYTEDEKKNNEPIDYNLEPEMSEVQEISADIDEKYGDVADLYALDGFTPDEPDNENSLFDTLDTADITEVTGEEPETAEDNENQSGSRAAELFEQRQQEYLVGKKVTKTIYDSAGQVIVQEGEIITNQIIQAVKEHGKLIELVMNYEG
ncbi:MAG: hypothetical protein GX187_08410 [Clostridiaceae bacterium]|nr:hypothetical protein [Clostridiaceae bacterium]